MLIAFVVITTYSTAGLTILLIQSTFIFMKKLEEQNFGFIAIIFMIPVFSIYSNNIENKIKDYESSSKRLFDLTNPFYSFAKPDRSRFLDVI